MDLGSAIRVLLRRWVVLVIGLVITLGATAYLYIQSRPQYQATANLILLLQPNAREAEGAGSSFLYLPNGLQVLAGIVVTGPDSREFRQEAAQEGYVSQFEIGVQVGSPIITVSVEGSDPENVIATRDRVIEGLQVELATVQREERTPARQTAHTRVYANEEEPTPIQGNRTRGVLMVIGVGGLLTLVTAFAIDRGLLILRDWRQRRSDPAHVDSDAETPDSSASSHPDSAPTEASSSSGQSIGNDSSSEADSDGPPVQHDANAGDHGEVQPTSDDGPESTGSDATTDGGDVPEDSELDTELVREPNSERDQSDAELGDFQRT